MCGIMKFKKYITEDWIDDNIDAKPIANVLKKNCAPFIKEMKSSNLHNWFYRATGGYHYEDISKPIKPRTNRKPRNTPKEIHEYMDMRCKKKFGWKSRSEGVFVSSHRNALEMNYGEPYLFFPIGSYKYIYHPRIKDIFEYFDVIYGISFGDEYIDIDVMEKKFDTIWPKYTDKNLKRAYENGVEVAFKCKSYYMVNEKYGDMLKKN